MLMGKVRGKAVITTFLIACIVCLTSCQRENSCHVTIGDAHCSFNPTGDALHIGLSTVGGYEYLMRGAHGVVVIRTGLTEYVAYERTCPCDDLSRVSMSEEWGGLLECPTCHTLFNPLNYGFPMDGGATPCPLFQYTAYYDGTQLHIY